MTSKDLRKSTCSPEPECGASPPGSAAGPTTDLFGQSLAPARGKASRGSASVPMIQGICGRTYIESLAAPSPADSPLLLLWESKLRQRLGRIGSTESALIWREKTTPQGRSISRLAPSTLHTNGSDYGGSLWPTPKAAHGGPDFRKREEGNGSNLPAAMWPTPKASAAGETSRSGDRKDEPLMGGLMRGAADAMAKWSTPTATRNGSAPPLPTATGHPLANQMAATAEKAMWITPAERDGKDSAGMSTEGESLDGDQIPMPGLEKKRQRLDQLPRQMIATEAAHWSTPRASDGEKGAPRQEFSGGGQPLPGQMYANNNTDLTVPGTPTPSGSSATTEKRGAPNPAFPMWLMGFPEEMIAAILRVVAARRAKK